MKNNDNLSKQNTGDNLKPLVVVMGPTASGKSGFAIDLAKQLNGEIISADSAQIYKDLSIITARVKRNEMQGIPHHLTGFLEAGEEFSVADFQKCSYEIIRNILKRNKTPVIAGGTILYIKAVVEGYLMPNIPPDPELRKKILDKIEKEGKDALYNTLLQRDPEAAERIHPNNIPRVVRALEVIEKSGRRFSDFYKKVIPHPLGIKPYNVWIDLPREELYERINRRVDMMIEQGAIEEVEKLVKLGKKQKLLDARILGVSEIILILEGRYSTKEGIELIKRNTRRYAKRQITWMKTFEQLHRITGGELERKREIEQIAENLKGAFIV
jgi:tRNA dimethylallyltransferase